MKKYYGELGFDFKKNKWVILKLQPHVMIKLKAIFPWISINAKPPIFIDNTDNNIFDLEWLMLRYPLIMTISNKIKLKDSIKKGQEKIEAINSIHNESFEHNDERLLKFKNESSLRAYQQTGVNLFDVVGHLLICDDVGLGKTYQTMGAAMLNSPALIIVKPHLLNQWKREFEEHTNLIIHVIDSTNPYKLPKADVYLSKYNLLYTWRKELSHVEFKMIAFDEIQELRRRESKRYIGAYHITKNIPKILGLSATPIYNYGDEMFHIMDIIKRGCLGVSKEDFLKIWTTDGKCVDDPKALGSFLIDNNLMIRRTRLDVGLKTFEFRKSIEVVPYDDNITKKHKNEILELSLRLLSGDEQNKGNISRTLDIKLRKITGLAKAKYVAQFAKFYLDKNEPIILTCWHRGVYDILVEELKEYKPLLFSGTESSSVKDENVQKFINGESNLFLMSLRSGDGLNGLDKRCSTILFAELDWSPAVHKQLTGRLSRDNQENPIDIIFVTTEFGSDPLVLDKIGLKGSQFDGMIDPESKEVNNVVGESRLKSFAEDFIKKNSSNLI